LPPSQLLLGFGVIFRISESSKSKHLKHRVSDDRESNRHSVEESNQDTPEIAENVVAAENAVPELDDEHDSDDVTSNASDAEEEEENTPSNPLQTKSIVTEPKIAEFGNDGLADGVEALEIDKAPKLPDTATPNDINSNSESDEDTDFNQTAGTRTPNTVADNRKGGPATKRGKRGKAKKIANKYKDQDEEDRLAAQQLIGASAGAEKARVEAEAKAQREAELAFQKERRKAQHQRTREETAAHEKLRREKMEQGIDEVDEAEEEQMAAIDALVGTPLRGDEILEAIPFCAPWAAMGKTKYKVKLQPGAQKKGKAIKEIIGRWLIASQGKGVMDEKCEDPERMWPREVELLKGWKVEEVTNTIPVGKVRVMMAGGSTNSASKGSASQKGKAGGRGSKKR
jgi:hypothetical protein